jgi:hypothetical protein
MPPRSKRLLVQKGTDEVNHAGVSYPTAHGPAEPEGIVHLPPEAAEHILRQGGAIEVTDETVSCEPSSTVLVRHINDPESSFSWGNRQFNPDENGLIEAPVEALAEIESHGFILA